MRTIIISNIIVIAVFLIVGCAAAPASKTDEAEPVETISDQPILERKLAVNAKKYNRNLPNKPHPETGIRLDRCSAYGLTFKYFLTETWVDTRYKSAVQIAEMKEMQREVVLENWRTGSKSKRVWMAKGVSYHYHYSDLYGKYLYDFKISAVDFRDVPNAKPRKQLAERAEPNAFDPQSREELAAMLPQWVSAWNNGLPHNFKGGSIDGYEHRGGTHLVTYVTIKGFTVGDPFLDVYGKGESRNRKEFYRQAFIDQMRHDWSDKTLRLMFYTCELTWDYVISDRNGKFAFVINLSAIDFP